MVSVHFPNQTIIMIIIIIIIIIIKSSPNKRMQQTSAKREQDETWLGGESDPQVIVQEIKIQPNCQMAYAQPRIPLGGRDAKNSLGFWHINRWPNPGQKIKLSNIKKKIEPAE